MATGIEQPAHVTARPQQQFDRSTILPENPEEVTATWLQHNWNPRIRAVEIRQTVKGTATKLLMNLFYSETHQEVERDQDGRDPKIDRVCIKGGFDPALFKWGTRKAYVREAEFYGRLAPKLDIRQMKPYFVTTNPTQGQGIIVLEDLEAAVCLENAFSHTRRLKLLLVCET
ncbi:hypothetical protein LTR10_023920 [Elasticomyces elasticus]|nr:hypothetical protein LTR10_023920 [Elasticomyces elasticus]